VVGRYLLALVLSGLLVLQIRGAAMQPSYLRVGEEVPALIQGGERVRRLDRGCVVAFVVSVRCPSSGRLASSFAQAQGGSKAPVWLVLEGPQAAWVFAETYGLASAQVLAFSGPGRVWGFWRRGREVRVPFIPARVVLDRGLVVKEVSLEQTLLTDEERALLCVP